MDDSIKSLREQVLKAEGLGSQEKAAILAQTEEKTLNSLTSGLGALASDLQEGKVNVEELRKDPASFVSMHYGIQVRSSFAVEYNSLIRSQLDEVQAKGVKAGCDWALCDACKVAVITAIAVLVILAVAVVAKVLAKVLGSLGIAVKPIVKTIIKLIKKHLKVKYIIFIGDVIVSGLMTIANFACDELWVGLGAPQGPCTACS